MVFLQQYVWWGHLNCIWWSTNLFYVCFDVSLYEITIWKSSRCFAVYIIVCTSQGAVKNWEGRFWFAVRLSSPRNCVSKKTNLANFSLNLIQDWTFHSLGFSFSALQVSFLRCWISDELDSIEVKFGVHHNLPLEIKNCNII